ncbi:MAG: ABC transporter ATP-binding protein [Lachnospiraceae bacterium]
MDKIEVRNVGKNFGDQKVVQNVSFDMESGKIYGLIGRNGSGKTVLMQCIAGFMKPTTGEIFCNGKQIGKEMKMLERMGFILNEPGFLSDESGYRNLHYLAQIRRIADKKMIREAMVQVGLDPDSKKHVGNYSLGMRQRLAIAQAIMEQPDILLLDEPMNALDEDGVEQMRELFLQLRKQGKLILMTSHNREDIDCLCDEVYQIRKGEWIHLI